MTQVVFDEGINIVLWIKWKAARKYEKNRSDSVNMSAEIAWG